MYYYCTNLENSFCVYFPNNQVIWDCELAQGNTGINEI